MKRKYHTVGTVIKLNRQVVERDKIDILNTNTWPFILLASIRDFNKKKNDKTYPVFTYTRKNSSTVLKDGSCRLLHVETW